jgi:hypothetical protein
MSNKSSADASDSDSSMDWSDNLSGVKELYGDESSCTTSTEATGSTTPPKQQPQPPAPQQSIEKETTTPVGLQLPGPLVGQPLEGPVGEDGGVQQPLEGLAPPPGPARGEEDPAGTSGDMAKKARDFVEKQMEEARLKLRRELGDKQLAYDAILAARKKDLMTKHLLDGEPATTPDVGSMVSTADRRLLRTTMEVSVGQRSATTTNFDPQRLTRNCAGPHSSYKMAGGGGYRAGREAILLTDQAYPPMLEAHGVRRCLKILRIEHGMLIELADALMALLRGRYIAAGSIVLLFSSTNLAVAGTSGYCADLMGAIERLKSGLEEHVVYSPLPHYFGAGCGDEMTIRSAVEVSAWATHFFGKDNNFLILILGSRDARRIKIALNDGGQETIMMHERMLIIGKEVIEELAEVLGKEVKRSRPEGIVLHILDDSVYKALTEEGVKIQHRRMGDSIYFDGDVACVINTK